jgi:hypothetical protein
VLGEHGLQAGTSLDVRRPQEFTAIDLKGVEHNEVGRHLPGKPGSSQSPRGRPPLEGLERESLTGKYDQFAIKDQAVRQAERRAH